MIACWFRGHDWALVRAGRDMGRACRRCYHSPHLTQHVFAGEDGTVIYGRFEGVRRWEWSSDEVVTTHRIYPLPDKETPDE